MSKDADSLVFKIMGDAQGLIQAFDKAQAAAAAFGGKIGKTIAPIRSGMNQVGSSVMKVVAPIGAAVTAWLSLDAVMKSFERADSLGKISQQLNLSVDSLSQLQYAAELSQSSTEELNSALIKMQVNLGKAAEKGGEAESAFAALGLTSKELAGISADEAFYKIVDGLNTVTSASERAALTQQIFGRSAGAMTAMLKQGSGAIREMGQAGKDLGRTMTALDVAKLSVAKDSLESLSLAFKSLSDKIAVGLTKVITFLSDEINGVIGDTREFGKTMDSVSNGIVNALGVVRVAWQGLNVLFNIGKVVVGGLSIAFYEAMRGITKAIMFVWGYVQKWYDAMKSGFKVVGAVMGEVWAAVKWAAVHAFAFIQDKFGKTIRAMGEAASASSLPGLEDIGDIAREAGTEMEESAARMKKSVNGDMREATDNLKAAVTENIKALAAFGDAPDTSTPKLDNLAEQAHNFFQRAKDDFTEYNQMIVSQEGGNALSQTWANFAKSAQETAGKVQDALSKMVQPTSVTKQLVDETAAVWAKFWEDHLAARQEFNDAMMVMDSENSGAMAVRQQDFNDNMALNDKKALDNQVMLWRSGAMGKMEAIKGILGNLEVLMQSKNKSMFRIGQAAALAQNVIDTIQSAASSYKFGSEIGGPVVGAAFAATAVAAGLVRAQQLLSARPGGEGGGSVGGAAGGGGGDGSGGEAAASQAQNSTRTNVNVALYGSNFSSEQVRGLISAINEQTSNNMTLKAQAAA